MTQRRQQPLVNMGWRGYGLAVGLLALVVASFWSLDLQWGQFLSVDALRKMGAFLGELLVP